MVEKPRMTANARRAVLIVSTTIDLAADRVVDKLLRRQVPVFRVNTDRLPYQSQISLARSASAGSRVVFHEAGRSMDAEILAAFWYRRIRMPPAPPEATDATHEYVFREAVATLRGALEVLSVGLRSFGSPCTLDRAESKVFQLDIAADLGFEIPNTVITSDPAELRRFASEHPRPLVAKPIHSGYLRTSDGDVGIFTQRVEIGDLVEIDNALPCPIIMQEEIPKVFDIRVTVVRDAVYATAIDSQSDPAAQVDWRRTSRPDLPHHRHELPRAMRSKCIEMAARQGTGFAAIDLVLTSDNRYVFLESNPNGEWLWIEDALGYPISDAIVRYLEEGR